MNNKQEMQLPANCKKLSLEEMMQNESGWYVNLQTGEMYITYKDINTTISWVTSFLNSLGETEEGVALGTAMAARMRLQGAGANRRRVTRGGEAPAPEFTGGLGVRINETGFSFFALTEAEAEAACSNTFVF